VPDRAAVKEFGQRIGLFFKKLNRLAEKRLLRKGLKLIGKPDLDRYYRDYYRSVKDGLKEWELTGRDLLFHGAPAVIVVATRPGGSCPMEDALVPVFQHSNIPLIHCRTTICWVLHENPKIPYASI
jgi:hypothetical protein